MIALIIGIFIVGYLVITLEHTIKFNKTSTALFTGILIWTIYSIAKASEIELINKELAEHLEEIAQILFFLIGAMTIVELIDAHQGFNIITDRISTKNKKTLLFIISIGTFFLSAVLDNLTTTIVMVSLLRKLIPDEEERKLFAGMVIIAANAGGAWSPIGDVTTTMLWLGGQITALNIMKELFVPSLVCCLLPALLLSFKMKGNLQDGNGNVTDEGFVNGRGLILFSGLGALIFVPVFKTITHLPPYMGMLLGLAFVWLISEIIHSGKDEEEKRPYTASHALSRIDTSSILFFLGILLAVGGLQSLGILRNISEWMGETVGNLDLIVIIIGLVSAIVDNVPLVAASMGMYDVATYPPDHKIWEFLAYCAGTGGSILILGSAAGVAVLGMEKIDFFWYLKKIGWLAFIGYIAGALVYLAIFAVLM
jgi:Na+/H+ antiporter NhaD/arsenite permease-like protein